MRELALLGGEPANPDKIRRYNSIDGNDLNNMNYTVMELPLSGYLGGELKGGHNIQRLERRWEETFNVKHAIACNSATSGLLAACHALGVHNFAVPCFTMSATAAAPKILGRNVYFCDVDAVTYTINEVPKYVEAIIAVNLFGQPANLQWLKSFNKLIIEDNAQAIFSTYDNKYAGTIGNIGVFSLNVHKHLQCGEGGIIVTNDDDFAKELRLFINHGELAGGNVGLNLRMTEVTAVIAYNQLLRAPRIVQTRSDQAASLYVATDEFEWLSQPFIRPNSSHVFYHWAFTINQNELGIGRKTFVEAMKAEGFPLNEGYVEPLYHLPAFHGGGICPIAEKLWKSDLIYFSNCEWTLSLNQVEQFSEALRKIESNITALRARSAA